MDGMSLKDSGMVFQMTGMNRRKRTGQLRDLQKGQLREADYWIEILDLPCLYLAQHSTTYLFNPHYGTSGFIFVKQ